MCFQISLFIIVVVIVVVYSDIKTQHQELFGASELKTQHCRGATLNKHKECSTEKSLWSREYSYMCACEHYYIVWGGCYYTPYSWVIIGVGFQSFCYCLSEPMSDFHSDAFCGTVLSVYVAECWVYIVYICVCMYACVYIRVYIIHAGISYWISIFKSMVKQK